MNGVYTIGQPRVGTPEFVKAMQENGPCMLQRIFNANDVVPSVPPSLDGFIFFLSLFICLFLFFLRGKSLLKKKRL